MLLGYENIVFDRHRNSVSLRLSIRQIFIIKTIFFINLATGIKVEYTQAYL